MALAPLAFVDDLLARGVTIADTDRPQAALKLEAASAAIREAAGVPISEATSTVKLVTDRLTGQWLDLPGQPVTAVTEVILDTVTLAATDYRLLGGRLWRECGWFTYWDEPTEVTITMTHGYTNVPADIVELVCDFAIAGINSSTRGTTAGIVQESETIDDYTSARTYASGADAQASIMEVPARTRQMLRQRFGTGAYVTGTS